MNPTENGAAEGVSGGRGLGDDRVCCAAELGTVLLPMSRASADMALSSELRDGQAGASIAGLLPGRIVMLDGRDIQH